MEIVIIITIIIFIVYQINNKNSKSSYQKKSNNSHTANNKKPQIIREFKFHEIHIYEHDKLVEKIEAFQNISECENMFVLTGYFNIPLLITDRASEQMYLIYACEDGNGYRYLLTINKLTNHAMLGKDNTNITYMFY